jgi:DNA repair exonuclease SbcCD ATPase subunit
MEPALGANGAGKSTVWDAVCWCVSDRSIKGLRTSELVSYGKDKTQVTTYWDIEGIIVRVDRTGPPSHVFIDGDPATTEDVERLLGLSRSRFLNSVIFGQAVPLFIDLPVPARGDLLDEVLDLELWMQAADKASVQHRSKAAELAELQNTIARVTGRIEGLPDVDRLAEMEGNWEDERKARVRQLKTRLKIVQGELRTLGIPTEDVVVDVAARKKEYEAQRYRLHAYERESGKLRAKWDRFVEEMTFIEENSACPVCGQDIGKEYAEIHGQHLKEGCEKAFEELEAQKSLIERAANRLKALESAWTAAMQAESAAKQAFAVIKANVVAKTREVKGLQEQVDQANAEVNPYTEQKIKALHDKDLLEAELLFKRDEEKAQVSHLAKLNYWRQGFKRVRLFCLENVLQELTVETRNSLLALGLIGWKIAFKTATETKSGSVKLGVQVDVHPPNATHGRFSKFDVLSGGEGQRARLAGSLGLASLVQRWAGVHYNFEVWDEPTAWLSSEGVENLLDCLSYRADSQQKSVWLCDHRALMHSSFAETYSVVKNNLGSHWERV